MIRYFLRGGAIACAESDGTATKLVARGYGECSRARYMHMWRLRDLIRRHELAMEDERPPHMHPSRWATDGRAFMCREGSE